MALAVVLVVVGIAFPLYKKVDYASKCDAILTPNELLVFFGSLMIAATGCLYALWLTLRALYRHLRSHNVGH